MSDEQVNDVAVRGGEVGSDREEVFDVPFEPTEMEWTVGFVITSTSELVSSGSCKRDRSMGIPEVKAERVNREAKGETLLEEVILVSVRQKFSRAGSRLQ